MQTQKVVLVAYCPLSTKPLTKLFRIREYAIMPRLDDNIEYEDGWGLSGINTIYLSLYPTLPEIYISSKFNDEEIEKLKLKGWTEVYPKNPSDNNVS